jgi:hypothetical protein
MRYLLFVCTRPAAGPTPPARERGDGARSRDAETCFGLPTFCLA